MKVPAPNPIDKGVREFLRGLALVLCAVALVAVCVRVTVQKRHKQSGYFIYVDAGRAFRDGTHLYTSLEDLPPREREVQERRQAEAGENQVRDGGAWGGYRYSPTAAMLFVPLSYMPGPWGEVIWRTFLAIVSFGALYWCAQVGLPRPLARRDWAIFFLLVLWPVTGCLNNGQSSCVIVACLLGSIAACLTDRWWLAAVLVVIATSLKLYPVTFGLLLSVLYPRQFSWKFVIALIVAAALPFAFRPSLVHELPRWWEHLVNDAKTLPPIESWDQDVRLLFYRILHIKLSEHGFMFLSAGVGCVVGLFAIAGRLANLPRRVLLTRTLGMAVCWMTAFGMATEPSTYILVSPILAWSIWETWLRPTANAAIHDGVVPGGWISRSSLLMAYGLFILAYVVLWFPFGHWANSFGQEPLAGVLLLGYLMVRSGREVRFRHRHRVGAAVLSVISPSGRELGQSREESRFSI